LDKKKCISNYKKIFYESQNFGSISLIFENNGILNFFRKIFLQNLKQTFSYATRQALSNHHEKRKKYSSVILNCEQITDSVNILKIEYLGSGSLWARNILNLLVWRRE
jgi:hypothetical protein